MKCFCYEVRNAGWRASATDCEILGTLGLPTGLAPIVGYWEGENKEVADIAPRDSRRFVIFLFGQDKDEVIFCSPAVPKVSSGFPLWQLVVGFGTPLRLRVAVRASDAVQVGEVANLVVRGRERSQIRVSKVLGL